MKKITISLDNEEIEALKIMLELDTDDDIEAEFKKYLYKINKDEDGERKRLGKMIMESNKVVKTFTCRKCEGVIVGSLITGMMAAQKGKQCKCKEPDKPYSRKKKV